MWLLRPPGVYKPQADTWLLVEALRDVPMRHGARVLDLGTGTGAVAVSAARFGAEEVIAVDVAAGAVWAARLNAAVRRLPVRARRGDVLESLPGERFDVVLANPPYVPGARCPVRGRGRAWEAGVGGREVLDPLCRTAPELLEPGGVLLVVHSALNGVAVTVERLRAERLKTSVVARRSNPFGPVMRRRAALWEEQGLIARGERHEELVIIRADRAETPA